MRDVIVSISREENFVHSSGDNVPRTLKENFRHIVCHGSDYQTLGMDWSRVRSLTFFGERPMGPEPLFCSPQLRMLRTLDLENAEFSFTQKEINIMGLLRHLKYVNVRCGQGHSNIYALPRSIGKLHGLQALDIRCSHISTLPTEISKLQSLRSLRCSKIWYYHYFEIPKECMVSTLCLPIIFTPLVASKDRDEFIAELHMAYSSCWSRTLGVRVPVGISKLKQLQFLEVVGIRRTKTKAIQELGELCHLRKLSVTTKGATDKKCKTLCEAVQKLSSLRSLSIDAKDDSGTGTLEWLGSAAFSPPPRMRSLKLYGYIGEMPDWFSNLTQVVKILLSGSKLKEGKAMEILGALPNLMILRLYWRAYAGHELVFREGAFQCLKKLDMESFYQLRGMKFEEGASPQMESIEIKHCKLESGITGINHLPRLKEISLGYGCKMARLGTLQEEVNGHRNQPVVRLPEGRSYHDLGQVEGTDVQVQATEPDPHPRGLAGDHSDHGERISATSAAQICCTSSHIDLTVVTAHLCTTLLMSRTKSSQFTAGVLPLTCQFSHFVLRRRCRVSNQMGHIDALQCSIACPSSPEMKGKVPEETKAGQCHGQIAVFATLESLRRNGQLVLNCLMLLVKGLFGSLSLRPVTSDIFPSD